MKKVWLIGLVIGCALMSGCRDSTFLDLTLGDMSGENTSTENSTDSKNDNSTHAAADTNGSK